MLLVILGSLGHSATSNAGTTVALRESYAGNFSFELTGGSFRTKQNGDDTGGGPNRLYGACQYANSSSSSLTTLRSGANIIKAYLYWAASADEDGNGNIIEDNQVTFNGINITADPGRSYTEDTGTWQFFNGVADVTNYVTGNGSFTVTDLDMYSTNSHCTSQTMLGGWALLVIYEHDNEDFRVLNLYEGFENFQNNSIVQEMDNFELPINPTGKFAHITWEGDDTLNNNESLSIDNIEVGSTPFDSWSNVQGGFTSYGVDIDEYDIPSNLPAGTNKITATYTAGQDLVLLSAEIISISNIPVADLSVTTSDPVSWLQGSTATKKYTISNNGPNDVPINSIEFSTILPDELTFSGIQGDSDWSCTQTGQNLSCIYKPKLRSGWTDYLDITFDVANAVDPSVTVLASVNHVNAPYEIFDNQAKNDFYTFTTSIESVAVVDLSASNKTYTDVSGDLLLAEDTLRYTITIDDASDLAVNGITVTDDLPANISLTPNAYTIISSPVTETFTAGTGINGTGTLTFTGINLAPGDTEQIIFEVKVEAGAQENDSLRNIANISNGSSNWQVDTGDITVTVIKPDLSPSTLEAIDKDGGLLESGDTITLKLTLDDLYDTDISTLQAIIHMPDMITDFNVTDPHPGTEITNTYVDIQGVSFSNSETPTLEIELTMDPDTINGTTFDFSAELYIGADFWTVVSTTLTVVNSQPAASGNKPLYLVNSDLTRVRPETDASPRYIGNQDAILEWEITPSLASDLTLSSGDFPVQLLLGGRQVWDDNETELVVAFYYDENKEAGRQLLANGSFPRARYDNGNLYQMTHNINLAADITIPAGSSLILTVDNKTYKKSTGVLRTNNNTNHRVYFHYFNDAFFSAVTLNADTVINVNKIEVWDKPFSDSSASKILKSQTDTSVFVRAEISDPFGAFDITDATIEISRSDATAYDFNNDNIDGSSNSDPNPDSNSMLEISSDTATKQFEKEIELLENQYIGDWVLSVTGIEGVEEDVNHTQVSTFKIIPFQPNIILSKLITVLNDPINDINNPKAIPGSELKYSITATNIGRGYADDGSLTIKDDIPEDAELFIGNLSCVNRGAGNGLGPVCYQDGDSLNESGLTYDFIAIDDLTDHLQFSQDGIDFTYTPVNNGDGYDSTIRHIKISPIGNLKASNKAVSFEPQFTFEYQIRLY